MSIKIYLLIPPGNLANPDEIVKSKEQDPEKSIRDDDIDYDLLCKFLEYLYNHKEFSVYYYLMNKAFIKSFCSNKCHIFDHSPDSAIQKEIRQLLFQWTEKQWSVMMTSEGREGMIFKDMLIMKFKEQGLWQSFGNKFPEAQVKEIIFSN